MRMVKNHEYIKNVQCGVLHDDDSPPWSLVKLEVIHIDVGRDGSLHGLFTVCAVVQSGPYDMLAEIN